MKKISWWNKPITWGASIIASLISMAISLIYVGYLFEIPQKLWGGFKNWIKGIRTKIVW